MIFDNIKNADKYLKLNPEFKLAFDYLRSFSKDEVELGKHVLSENCYVNVQAYENKLRDDAKFENHLEYADIQFISSGNEEIDVTDVNGLTLTEDKYAEKDVAKFAPAEKYSTVLLHDGDFLFVLPGEAHRPGIAVDGKKEQISKVVVKIKM